MPGFETLPNDVQLLLNEHQQHQASLLEIDHKLAQVTTALTGTATAAFPKAASPATPSTPAKRRGRKPAGGITADEFVLAFVQSQDKPSTADVSKHWSRQKRKGTANNMLTKLVKEKKLKRIAAAGVRGSVYAVA